MMRLLLLVVVLLLLVAGGAAVALNHFFGWKGLVAFPFVLLVFAWLGKIIIGKLLKRLFLGLFSLKSGVLRGASLTVHSVTAVSRPAPTHADAVPPTPAVEDAVTPAEQGPEDTDTSSGDTAETEPPQDYFAVDLTVTPTAEAGDRVWEPAELILTSERVQSLSDLEDGDRELGTAHEVLVWTGSEFGPDDPGKYPGPQRLKVTFAVKPGTTNAWVHYYDVPLGQLQFPAPSA